MIPNQSVHIHIGKRYPLRESIAAPTTKARPLSPKYEALCEEILAAIQRVKKGNRPDFGVDCSRSDFATATKYLSDAGKIIYDGHAPHGFWRIK